MYNDKRAGAWELAKSGFHISLNRTPPYDKMDIALLACNSGEPSAELSKEFGIGLDQAEFIYRDIEAKRKATATMLH